MAKIAPFRTSATQKRNTVIRWIFYCVLIFFSVCILSAGTSIKPLLLIPIALCIAAVVKEGAAIAMGIVCGLLLDLTCHQLLGSNAIFMMLVCLFTSYLYTHYLQHRLFNHLVLTAAVSLLHGVLVFFFSYFLWDYDNVGLVFLYTILPSCGYTLLSAVVIYGLFHFVHERLLPHTSHTITRSVHSNLESDIYSG